MQIIALSPWDRLLIDGANRPVNSVLFCVIRGRLIKKAVHPNPNPKCLSQ
jgi:hypothetical protein